MEKIRNEPDSPPQPLQVADRALLFEEAVSIYSCTRSHAPRGNALRDVPRSRESAKRTVIGKINARTGTRSVRWRYDAERRNEGHRAMTIRPLHVLRGCFLLPLLFCGCAAYQIGNQSLYPLEIHTVAVPVFQSNSFRRNLGERLTEAVVKEIEKKNAVQSGQRSLPPTAC